MAVTWRKLAYDYVSATSRILGRKTAGAGKIEELTLSEVLDLVGSAARGDIFYRGASTWARLAKGPQGYVLGQGANDPAWTIPISPRDIFRNLVINNNATYPAYKLDITADEIILQDSNGMPYRLTSFSKTVSIAASGADGLDTGAEAGSTWYHVWAICKSSDGTAASLLSASATGPTMPAGYDCKAYLGAVYNNSSSNFATMRQSGNRANIEYAQVLSGGSQTSYTSISLTAVVPTTAKWVFGYMYLSPGAVGANNLFLAPSSDGAGQVAINSYSNDNTCPFEIGILTAQTIYYKITGTHAANIVMVTGWGY